MDFDETIAGRGTDERAALRRARRASRLLDESVRVPGTEFRVGLDPILSVIPGGGDAVAAALSLYVVGEAARAGVPTPVLLRMLANVGVDAVGGSVPVAGTAFDVLWKANERNVKLFESYVEAREERGTTTVPVE
jgi:hypothetical protein